jgi:hypothetical protein
MARLFFVSFHLTEFEQERKDVLTFGCREGIYTLSTRSLLELRNYLQNEFEEHYHTCTHCKDVVTLGLACSHAPRSCSARYHMHCARNTIGSAVNDDEALARLTGFPCPVCRRTWKSRPIGPKALVLVDRDTPFSSQPDHPRHQPAQNENDDSDADVESQLASLDGEESAQQQQPVAVKPEPAASQPARRQSQRRRIDDSDDDEQDVKPRRRLR